MYLHDGTLLHVEHAGALASSYPPGTVTAYLDVA